MDSGSVVTAITRPAPIFTIAASWPARGPTATSARAAPRCGAIRRSNAAGESLPSGAAAPAPVAGGAPAAAGSARSGGGGAASLIGVSIQRRSVEDRVRHQALGVAPVGAEERGARDHHHVAVAV